MPHRSSAVPARPRPAARPAPARPDLRVVPASHRRRGAIASAAIAVVFAVLFATAALHAMLVTGQRDLDRLDASLRERAQENQVLALEAARLEAPDRVVAVALAAGLVAPDEVTWLAPGADGTTDVVVSGTAGGSTTGPAPDGVVDERAGEVPAGEVSGGATSASGSAG